MLMSKMKDENKICSILHCKLCVVRVQNKEKLQQYKSWMIAAERNMNARMCIHLKQPAHMTKKYMIKRLYERAERLYTDC